MNEEGIKVSARPILVLTCFCFLCFKVEKGICLLELYGFKNTRNILKVKYTLSPFYHIQSINFLIIHIHSYKKVFVI